MFFFKVMLHNLFGVVSVNLFVPYYKQLLIVLHFCLVLFFFYLRTSWLPSLEPSSEHFKLPPIFSWFRFWLAFETPCFTLFLFLMRKKICVGYMINGLFPNEIFDRRWFLLFCKFLTSLFWFAPHCHSEWFCPLSLCLNLTPVYCNFLQREHVRESSMLHCWFYNGRWNCCATSLQLLLWIFFVYVVTCFSCKKLQ